MKATLSSLLLAIVVAALATGCAHPPLKDPKDALRPTSAPDLADDLPLEPLAAAIDREVAFLEQNAAAGDFRFGARVVPKAWYLRGLRRFAELARAAGDRDAFFRNIAREFEFLEVYGNDKGRGTAFMTSYYEAVVPGARKKTKDFPRPLYGVPKDIIALDLKAFDPDKYSGDRKLRGRVVDGKLVPYFSREEIDANGALKGRRLELAWVDPIDAHDIQVQGSGIVQFKGGTQLRVGYAERNGHPYDSIGKYVREFIPKEKLSLQAIEDYLHGLSPEAMQKVLNKDESYIFFKETTAAETSLGVPATDGRTIATDQRLFPKGALAFLVSTKPKWADAGSPVSSYVPLGWESFSRFVLDQDIGGAITGPGRLDLFWGSGPEAKRNAGVIKQDAKLFYLIWKGPAS